MQLSMEAWKNPDILDSQFRPHYREDLAYYSYRHPLETAAAAEPIAEAAIAAGIEVEPEVLPIAARGHDAGKHLPLDPSLANSEAYAADITRRIGRELSMPEELLELAGDAIEDGNPDAPYRSPTAICLTQGDLVAGGVLADEPVIFLNGTYRILKDERHLKRLGLPKHWEDPETLTNLFVELGDKSRGTLTKLIKGLTLGDHERDEDGRNFPEQAMRNIGLLEEENLRRILGVSLKSIVEYQPSEEPPFALPG